MKHKLTLASVFLALALTASASSINSGPVSILGFEDWTGPGSDRDFNDLVITVTGVNFITSGEWTRPDPAPYPSEAQYPFPTAYYFSDALVFPGASPEVTFDFAETAGHDSLYVSVGSSGYQLLSGHLSFLASSGDEVRFKFFNGSVDLFPTASLNSDLLPHVVETTLSPEPSTVLLFGAGLVLISRLPRFRRKEVMRDASSID